LTRLGIAAALVLLLTGAAYLWGRQDGRALCEGAHAAALAQAQAATIRIEAERLAIQAERDALARDLEDQAHADPVRNPDCLSADRVRRLNLR
jgi:hypothetical protein